MVGMMKEMGPLKSVLTIAVMIVTITTALWGLSENLSHSVSSNVEGTARQVIKDELTVYGSQAAAERSRVIDEKIKIHALESELEMNEKLDAIKQEQTHTRGKLDEILRRLPK